MYELTKPDYLEMSLKQHGKLAVLAFIGALLMMGGMVFGGAAMLIVATTDIEFKEAPYTEEYSDFDYEYDYSGYLEEFEETERKITLCPSTITLYDDNGCPLPSVYTLDYE